MLQQKKCERYWPLYGEAAVTFGPFRVSCVSIKLFKSFVELLLHWLTVGTQLVSGLVLRRKDSVVQYQIFPKIQKKMMQNNM